MPLTVLAKVDNPELTELRINALPAASLPKTCRTGLEPRPAARV